jgi:glycosyltransferase involved in cell wall biosynthesis
MRVSRDPVLSVVVPVYNERSTIKRLLRRVIATPRHKEIIIVDDCSSDGTREIVASVAADWASALEVTDKTACQRTTVKVVMQPGNFGKGAALAAGFTKVSGDVVIIQDADLEYDPDDYEKLLAPIVSGAADVVYGSRFAGETRRVLNFWHAIGNRALTLLSNITTNLDLTDMETCYKMFRADLLERFTIRSKRFGVEPEITAKFARMKARIFEVPVRYSSRTAEAGKKIGWKDAVSAICTIFKYSVVNDVQARSTERARRGPLRGSASHDRLLWSMIEPHVGDSILEVGAGCGGISRFLVDRAGVTLTDPSPANVESLCSAFVSYPHVSVERMNIDGEPSPALLMKEFDTLISAHEAGCDLSMLRRMNALLRPGGRLLLVSPVSYAFLGPLFRLVGRVRGRTQACDGWRNRASLCSAVRKAGFEVRDSVNITPAGALAWYFSSLFASRTKPTWAEALINRATLPLGTCVVTVAVKSGVAVEGADTVTSANLRSSLSDLKAVQARSGGKNGGDSDGNTDGEPMPDRAQRPRVS